MVIIGKSIGDMKGAKADKINARVIIPVKMKPDKVINLFIITNDHWLFSGILFRYR